LPANLPVHLEGFPTCETMLLVLTSNPNVFKMLVYDWATGRGRFYLRHLRNCGTSHEKHAQTAREKTEKPCDNACCETLTAFPHK